MYITPLTYTIYARPSVLASLPISGLGIIRQECRASRKQSYFPALFTRQSREHIETFAAPATPRFGELAFGS